MSGLADEERDDVVSDTAIAMKHMGPPLKEGSIQIQACGSAELTYGESCQIKVFYEEHYSEYEAEKVR